jgi:hypothetical protein
MIMIGMVIIGNIMEILFTMHKVHLMKIITSKGMKLFNEDNGI